MRPKVSARHMIIVSPISIVLLTNWEKTQFYKFKQHFAKPTGPYFPARFYTSYKKYCSLYHFPLLILLEVMCSRTFLKLFQIFISLVIDFALLCG